ncbi:MAG: hypothetical protein GIW99_12480 [Candidatus Eremiobacteraeota bacterium]|nr:hypothetical protein [Candidatus Eremiobacteraeota bacterium]MBC5828474.1 hypothetical protein [Candidatus Eremiobacteraeota bacterium]
MIRFCAVVLAAAALLASAPPGVPSADSIFLRAAQTARANPYPPYLTYVMHEVFVHHGKRVDYDYRVWYRGNDGKALMQNLGRSRRGGSETFFGYPFPFSPDVNFLLNATPEPASPPPPPVGSPVPTASGAKSPHLLDVEAVVSNRNYDVSLAGVEDYAGHPVYHLTLRAIRDERAHPLKNVWVDRSTFQVWKAQAGASGNKGPAAGFISGQAEFGPVGPYWLVRLASGDGQLRFGFLSDSGHYEYVFSDLGFPPSLPDWYFDSKQFARHAGR